LTNHSEWAIVIPNVRYIFPAMNDTKEQITKTARELFTERGYFNTSIRDVSKEAGLSTGAIYYHFKSKEEIASEIFNNTTSFLLQEFKQAVQEGVTGKDKIFSIISTMLRLADEQSEIMEYALHVKHRDIMEGGKTICSSEPFELIKDFIREEMARGNIRQMDVYTAAVGLTSMPIRFMQLKWDGVLDEKLINRAEEIFTCVWGALKP